MIEKKYVNYQNSYNDKRYNEALKKQKTNAKNQKPKTKLTIIK